MTTSEIIIGPEARLIIRETAGRWTCAVDARSVGTMVCGMSGVAGPIKGLPTRAAAIAHAESWMRRFFGSNLHPRQDAWLREIAPAQGDLFGAAA